MLNYKLLDKRDALQAKLQTSNRKISNLWSLIKNLSEPSTSPECYWTLLKTLLNGRKIACIPPLFHDSKFITDFKEKSETFNSVFAKHCSLIGNGSITVTLSFDHRKITFGFDFSVQDIRKITSKLDSNKAHGDDMFSIRILKLCDKSICKPLNIIFKSYSSQNRKKQMYQFIKKR